MSFWRGHGLWRIPNFFKSVSLDAPKLGYKLSAHLHYRRLTLDRAARRLPPVPLERTGPELPVYFMSGREHWSMTAFCAFTLLSATDANLVPVVLEDGSLTELNRAELRRILPAVRFLDSSQLTASVERHVPAGRFPSLHRMRRALPLMRKLMDLHAGQTGCPLFLDSDMLFFRNPRWMLDWLRAPRGNMYMSDYQNSYGYGMGVLQAILGRPVVPFVNTGFCALQSDALDWDLLEHWAAALLAAAGVNHFSEQCLTAMWISVAGGEIAPAEYKIWPSEEESKHPTAVMHHYVAESRTWYHVHGWPQVLTAADSIRPGNPARIGA